MAKIKSSGYTYMATFPLKNPESIFLTTSKLAELQDGILCSRQRAPAVVARVVLPPFEQTLRRLASCSVAAQASVSLVRLASSGLFAPSRPGTYPRASEKNGKWTPTQRGTCQVAPYWPPRAVAKWRSLDALRIITEEWPMLLP